MSTPSRLRQLEREMFGGQPDAVWPWALEVRRRNLLDDPDAVCALFERVRAGRAELLAAVVVALGAWTHAAQWLVELAPAARIDAARSLGVELTAADVERLRDLVQAADTWAPPGEHTAALPLATLLEARLTPLGLAVGDLNADEPERKTVLAIAVEDPERDALVVSVARARAKSLSPGRVWKALQPWQRHHERNLDKALAWARTTRARHVVRLACVVLPDAVRAALEHRPVVEHDPIRELAATPGRAAFKKLVKLIESADGAESERLTTVVERAIEPWPDDVRAGARSWLRTLSRQARAGAWSPANRLVRHLEIDDRTAPDDAGLDALLDSPLSDSIRQITFRARVPALARRLLHHGRWPRLRRIVFEWSNQPDTLEALATAPTELIERLVDLRVGSTHEPATAGLPAVFWPPPADGGLVVELRVVCDERACLEAWDEHLVAIVRRTPRLTHLSVYDTRWPALLVRLCEGGALPSGLHLSLAGAAVSASTEPALALAAAGGLVGLALSSWPAPLDYASDLAESAALGTVRHLVLDGEVARARAPQLVGSALMKDLDALVVHYPFEIAARDLSKLLGWHGFDALEQLCISSYTLQTIANWLHSESFLPGLRCLTVRGATYDARIVPKLRAVRPGLEIEELA